jgi:hypothetical protein
MKRASLSLIAILLSWYAFSQNALKPYQWRDHLPYNKASCVTSQGNKIYAVVNECVFSYNKNDGSYERLNKIYGFSDIEPSIVKNNPYNNAIVIVYKNSNIDVISNGAITNIPDLYRKQNMGDKTVNAVTFSGKLAYLACGFGIVVFDTETFEFKDTYIIGPNATNLFVYQVALSNTEILAATKSGVYKAPLSSSNLSSFTSWSKVTSIPNGPYNGIVYFDGVIVTSYSQFIQSNYQIIAQDTLYQYDGNTWSHWNVNGPADLIRKLSVSDNGADIIIIDNWGFVSYDTTGANTIRYWGDYYYPPPAPGLAGSWNAATDAIPDPTEHGYFWLADKGRGLYKVKGTPLVDPITHYTINGPEPHFSNVKSARMAIKDGKLIMAPAFLDIGMFSSYNQDTVCTFADNTWKNAKTSSTTNFDINCMAFDKNDKNHYYAGSWWTGVIEYVNDVEVHRFDDANTGGGLHATDFSGSTNTQVGGLVSDLDNNLWAGMGNTQRVMCVKKAGTNTWVSLDFTSINSNNGVAGPLPRVSQIIVDTNKQVWAVAYGVGLFVYKHDGSFSQPNNSNAKRLTNLPGYGGLASTEVICIAEDKNHDIWVGTDKGISVFYNPESIFSQNSGWDAQPIYIQQDGKTQLLLQTDEVSAITVDGANNKWCGTRSSGLYCFSSDGQQEIYHFTTDNSPLFSNSIEDIQINSATGEVFIATDKGVLSFQNIVTEGGTEFKDVYAYPNPVKPNYEGPILIHGMMNGAVIKILDVAGNFVYETTAKGGQAVWDGKSFSGQRVASGVYVVLCSTSDGSQKVMTKIMLLN